CGLGRVHPAHVGIDASEAVGSQESVTPGTPRSLFGSIGLMADRTRGARKRHTWISIGCGAIDRALRSGMDWQTRSASEGARLDARAAEAYAPRQEHPTMEATLSQQRILRVIAVSAVGIAVASVIHTPFGLLAPVVALFLFASGRTGLLLHVASATGLVGSLLVAAFYEGEARDLAVVWAAFFALAICIGA